MIPKIIHYCWFGRNPLPEKVKYCINTWKEFLPDYEFKLWNEDNFDLDSSVFVKEAYAEKKYAFVSDYVRVYVMEMYGGFYLDTDIEVVRTFNSLLNHEVLLGTDECGYLTAFMASVPHHSYFKNLLNLYNGMKFLTDEGANTIVNNTWMQEELSKFGYCVENKYQKLSDSIEVYPDDFFHAKSLVNGELHVTDNTYCIHHHTLLWISPKTKLIKFIRMKILVPLIGRERYVKLTEKLRKRR